jgi:hypothetical protein
VTTKDAEIQARIEQLGRFFMGTADVHLAMARVVKTLEELGISYAICGAMAVNVHGLRRATEDVDVLLTPEGLAKFKAHALGRGFVEKFPGSRGVRDAETKVPIDFLLTGGVPGDGVMRGMTFPDPKDVAIENAGKRYVDLATLVGMKLASAMTAPDRPRDLDDVIRLIRANELGEHFADGLHPYVREKYCELWRIAQMPPAMES